MTTPRCTLFAAVLVLSTTVSLRAGSTDSAPIALTSQSLVPEIYAGASENQFHLLRETKSVRGGQLGARTWFLSWLGVDMGVADFGTIKNAFPVQPSTGGGALHIFDRYGTNTLHVSARSAYALAVLRVPCGHRMNVWLALGPERFESKMGSDLYAAEPGIPQQGGAPVDVGPNGLEANFFENQRSWTGMGKAGVDFNINSSLAIETELHITGAPAISDPRIYSGVDIGARRLDIWGGGLSIVYRFGHNH